MALDKEKKSNRLLASKRYTHDSFTDAQEAFTSTLDIQASEVYTEANLIPTSSLPFSGSSQHEQTFSVDGKPIVKYYFRHKLTKSNLNNEVWFFNSSYAGDSGMGAQVITGSQQTNFVSPKYAIPELSNTQAEHGSAPGYLVKLFKSTQSSRSNVTNSDVVSGNDFTFDYKTGVVQFSSNTPSNSQYVYMSVYQYVGKTLASGVNVSGNIDTTGNLTVGGNAVITGNISGSSTSTGSFGSLNVDSPKLTITPDGVISGSISGSFARLNVSNHLSSSRLTNTGKALFGNISSTEANKIFAVQNQYSSGNVGRFEIGLLNDVSDHRKNTTSYQANRHFFKSGSGSELMRIVGANGGANNAKVGIGTDNPYNSLQIHSTNSSSPSGLILTNPAGPQAALRTTNQNRAVLSLFPHSSVINANGGQNGNEDTGSFTIEARQGATSYIRFGEGDHIFQNSSNGASVDYITLASGSNTVQVHQPLSVTGSVIVTGNITAEQFIVSSSVINDTVLFKSGSTKFGDDGNDVHEFTGSLVLKGTFNNSGTLQSNGLPVISSSAMIATDISGSFTQLSQSIRDSRTLHSQSITARIANVEGGSVGGGSISGNNSGDVSLAGLLDYLSISNQQITMNQIDLATDVTGKISGSHIGSGAATAISGAFTTVSASLASRVASVTTDTITAVATSTGLTGGGSSGDLTLSVDFSDSDFASSISGSFTGASSSFSTRTTNLEGRNINSGTGITGGGNLGADRTLSIDFSDSTFAAGISGSFTSVSSSLAERLSTGQGTQASDANITSENSGEFPLVFTQATQSAAGVNASGSFVQPATGQPFPTYNIGTKTLSNIKNMDTTASLASAASVKNTGDELQYPLLMYTSSYASADAFTKGTFIQPYADIKNKKPLFTIQQQILYAKQLSGSFIGKFSSDIKSAITGAFNQASASFSSRITAATQSIASLDAASASFSTRISTEESNVDTLQARDLIAGTGLTGGGDLTSDRTFNVIGGKGIAANADDIQVDFSDSSFATGISGSFTEVSASITSRLTTEENNVDNLQATSSALISDFTNVQSLGKTDNVKFNHITGSGNLNITGNISGSITSTGSFGRLESRTGKINGDFHVTDDLTVTDDAQIGGVLSATGNTVFGNAVTDRHEFIGHITASGNISASGTIFADNFSSTGGDVEGISFSDDLKLTGDITASGHISASSTSTGSFGRINSSTIDIDSIQGNWTNAGNTVADLGSITTVDINGGTIDGITSLTAGGNLDIGSHDFRAQTITADGLTSGRVVFAGTNGVLSDDSDFTFSTDTLTVTKLGAYEQAGAVNFSDEAMTNVNIDSGAIDGTNITVGSGKTLDVSAGTLTLADDQISGDKVEGGTIAATTITSLSSTSVSSTHVTASGNISGSSTSTGSFGNVHISGMSVPNMVTVSSSLGDRIGLIESSTITGVTSSLGIKGGANFGPATFSIDFSDTAFASGISGSLGVNADLIRSLTAAGITGSWSPRVTVLEGTGETQGLGTTNSPQFANLTVDGTVTAQNFIVSSSITIITQSFSSGSTIFGDTLDDTHEFTGSFIITGSMTSNGLPIISSSAQIADDISGSFTAVSSSISTRLTAVTASIASLSTASASFSTRISTEETNVDTLQARNINTGLGLTGGGDLTSDRTLAIDFSDSTFASGITGSFNAASASFSTRITAVEINLDDDMPFAGDSGTGTIDFDSETFTIAGGTNVTTAADTNTLTVNVDDAFLINSGDDTTSGKITAGGFNTAGHVTASGNISGSSTTTASLAHIQIPDDGQLSIGSANDLQLYHDGNNSFIKDAGTGNLNYLGGTQIFQNAAENKTMMTLNAASSVELRFNNVKKFETTNGGILVTGNITGSGNLEVSGNISGSITSTGSFSRVEIAENANVVGNLSADKLTINNIVLDNNTISTTGDLTLDPSGDDILVENNNIVGTGQIKDFTRISGSAVSTGSIGRLDVAGDLVPTAHNNSDLGSPSNRWANIYSADLQLSNENNHEGNEIDGTKGSWTIQEGEDDLYLLNRKNGKKYRFKLEEIT